MSFNGIRIIDQQIKRIIRPGLNPRFGGKIIQGFGRFIGVLPALQPRKGIHQLHHRLRMLITLAHHQETVS
ncbi:hypothetical protein D3C71_2186350 [compost metagenome]